MKLVAILSLVCGVTFGCDSLSLDPDRASAPVVAWCAVGESAANKGVVTAEKTRDQMAAEELWNELRTKCVVLVDVTKEDGCVEFDAGKMGELFNWQNASVNVIKAVISLIDQWYDTHVQPLDVRECDPNKVKNAVQQLTGKNLGVIRCAPCFKSLKTCLQNMRSFLDQQKAFERRRNEQIEQERRERRHQIEQERRKIQQQIEQQRRDANSTPVIRIRAGMKK